MTPSQLQRSILWPIPGGSDQLHRTRRCAERLGLRLPLVSSLCLALLLAACAPPAPLPTPPLPAPTPTAATPTVLPTPSPAILQAIDQGKTFLHAQYDPGVRLLRESPIVAPERHWLATDNRLAVYALAAAGDGLAPSVAAVLAEYGAQFDAPQHGLIEALTGAPIPWPPRTHTHTELAAGVWNEERLSGVAMDDWLEYADLTLYGALEAWHRGDVAEARRRYAAALALFDGIGFADRARDSHYTTYKLALALWVGHRLGEPLRPDLLTALLSKQDASGGFVTLYNLRGTPEGDANTETTSYALLALTALAR